jgi:NADH:ubiquinone oxidoreductase subunit K
VLARLKKAPFAGAVGFVIACSVCLLPAAGALVALGAVTSAVGGATGHEIVVAIGVGAAAVGLAAAIYLWRRRSPGCGVIEDAAPQNLS